MPIKLLIADDERLFRQSLKILLETGTDLRVVADAANGQEAVTGARTTTPDLALLDVDMPKMDGLKAARLIAADLAPEKNIMVAVHHRGEKNNTPIWRGHNG